MGNFYVNITMKGPERGDIADYLRARKDRAYVSPTVDGITTVAEERCEMQDFVHITALTAKLSKHFDCPAFAVLNHDDSVLMYWLFDKGNLNHEFDSDPSYFAEIGGRTVGDSERRPAGGNAKALCKLLGCPGDVEALVPVLTKTSDENEGLLFAYERHAALLKALGIPTYPVGMGWRYLKQDEYPKGLSAADFVETL